MSGTGPNSLALPPSHPGWRAIAAKVDPFLASILLTVAVASLLPARGDAGPVVKDIATAAISLLFFIYGARLSPRAAWDGAKSWRLHLTVLVTSFGLFPLLGLACRLLQPHVLTPQLYLGVMFVCILPSTVQSSIAFTSIAGGNVPAAICSASFSNLAGVVLTPVLAAIFIGSAVNFSVSSVLRIAGQIVLPFLLGQLARPWIGDTIQRHRRATSLTDRGSVLLVVYSTFSEGVIAGVWHQISAPQLVIVAAVDLGLLGIVLGLTSASSRRLGFSRADRITITFCGSKKSMATGVPLAAVLFAHQNISLLVLPLMIFHQIQLTVCAVLARRAHRRVETGLPSFTDQHPRGPAVELA